VVAERASAASATAVSDAGGLRRCPWCPERAPPARCPPTDRCRASRCARRVCRGISRGLGGLSPAGAPLSRTCLRSRRPAVITPLPHCGVPENKVRAVVHPPVELSAVAALPWRSPWAHRADCPGEAPNLNALYNSNSRAARRGIASCARARRAPPLRFRWLQRFRRLARLLRSPVVFWHDLALEGASAEAGMRAGAGFERASLRSRQSRDELRELPLGSEPARAGARPAAQLSPRSSSRWRERSASPQAAARIAAMAAVPRRGRDPRSRPPCGARAVTFAQRPF